MSAQLRTRPMSRKTVYRKFNALNNEINTHKKQQS